MAEEKLTLVSIIIPVYQVSDYVERCLLSVMNQTYKGIECIIVNDATRDDSITKCQRLIEDYDGPIKFRILHHERNKGLSAARNTGTDAATGNFLYYLDSDDDITPDCLEKLVSIAEEQPRAEMVLGNSIIIPYDRYSKIYLDKRLPDALCAKEEISEFYHKHWIPTSAWNKLIKRSFIVEHELFFKEGLIYEDLYWMFFVVKHLNYVSFCKDITYHYYMRLDSIVNATDSNVEGNSFLIIYNTILNNLTPNREQIELDGYAEGFCKRYMKYRKIITEFNDLYSHYCDLTKQFGCRQSLLKLRTTKLLVQIPAGNHILQIMKVLKTNIQDS